MLISKLVPRLDELITFVGATIGVILALILPALLDTLTFAPDHAAAASPKRKNWRLAWQLTRNGSFIVLGLLCGIGGVIFEIQKIANPQPLAQNSTAANE